VADRQVHHHQKNSVSERIGDPPDRVAVTLRPCLCKRRSVTSANWASSRSPRSFSRVLRSRMAVIRPTPDRLQCTSQSSTISRIAWSFT
jgi:hypothetical protein